MSGFDKVVLSYTEALSGLQDGMTVIAGGFGLCGIPEGCIAQIKRMGHHWLNGGFQQLWCRWIWSGFIT